jgi:O-antigen/teichoic acid export membrane protein
MVARLLAAALGIAVPMVLARVLAPADFGIYKQAWLVASTLHYVLPLGMALSLYYFVPREPERRGAFLGQSLAFTAAAGGVAAAALLALDGPVRRYVPGFAGALPWTAAATGFLLAGTTLDVAYNSLGKVRAGAAVRAVTEVGRGLAMIAGGLWTRSALGVLAGIAAATGLRAALGVALLAREARLELKLPELRRQLAYALPFGGAALLFVPQMNFHLWAVAAGVDAATFAIYSVGCFQLPIVDILYTPVSEILQLGIAESERQGRREAALALFREAVARLAFVFVPTMGLLLAVAPWLVSFLFTDRYLGAVPVMRVSVLSIALAALPLDGVLRARADRRFMLGSSAAKLAVTVPLVVGGLRASGLVGAIGGFVLAEALVRAVQLRRVARLLATGLAGVLPWRELSRLALATAASMPVAWAAARLLPAPALLRLAGAGSVFLATYLAVLAAGGWLPAGFTASVRRLAAVTALRSSAAGRRVRPQAEARQGPA